MGSIPNFFMAPSPRVHGSTACRPWSAIWSGPEYLQAYAEQRPVLVERRRRVRGVSIMIAKLILPLSSDGRAIDLLLAGSYPHPSPIATSS